MSFINFMDKELDELAGRILCVADDDISTGTEENVALENIKYQLITYLRKKDVYWKE